MRNEQSHRLFPKLWWRDYVVLKLLKNELFSFLSGKNKPKQNDCIVDLGAGEQPYRSIFEKVGVTYIACDIDSGNQVDCIIDPVNQTTPLDAGCAQCVCSFQVLEHVKDVQAYLREARRLLDKEGTLLLSTHGVWLYHPHPGDYRRWTRDGLINELAEAGFSVRSIRGLMGPLAWTTQFRLLGYCYVLDRFGFVGRLIGGGMAVFMNLRIKLEDTITPADIRNSNAAVYFVEAYVE